jgi:hypothetical protein
MRIKALVLSVVVAGGLLAGAGGASNLAAHAAPSAARSAAPSAARSAWTCPTTVFQTIPLYDHVTIHAYVSLMRNLCDGNVFTRVSTDLWGSYVNAWLGGPGGPVSKSWPLLPFGGYVDSPELPYTSGATYEFSGYATVLWGPDYYGRGSYTVP